MSWLPLSLINHFHFSFQLPIPFFPLWYLNIFRKLQISIWLRTVNCLFFSFFKHLPAQASSERQNTKTSKEMPSYFTHQFFIQWYTHLFVKKTCNCCNQRDWINTLRNYFTERAEDENLYFLVCAMHVTVSWKKKKQKQSLLCNFVVYVISFLIFFSRWFLSENISLLFQLSYHHCFPNLRKFFF